MGIIIFMLKFASIAATLALTISEEEDIPSYDNMMMEMEDDDNVDDDLEAQLDNMDDEAEDDEGIFGKLLHHVKRKLKKAGVKAKHVMKRLHKGLKKAMKNKKVKAFLKKVKKHAPKIVKAAKHAAKFVKHLKKAGISKHVIKHAVKKLHAAVKKHGLKKVVAHVKKHWKKLVAKAKAHMKKV